ncbi:MAG: hypothetical protein ABI442_22665 [Gemmatimonadaceae bacterium]
MTPPLHRPFFDWEAAGRDLGAKMGGYNSFVVIGANPVATGLVAVGIARAQALQRRVALGDLFAESPPIQALVQTDDPHGLVDSFLYGVSITKIAYEVAGPGELFVMPSGTDAPPYEEMLPSPRWQRLTAGFREMGALLILAAPASAPRLADLIAVTDGAVLVGDAIPGSLPDVPVLGSVKEPRAVHVRRTAPEPAALPTWSRKKVAGLAGIALTVVVAGMAAWLAYRPFAQTGRGRIGSKPDSARNAMRAIPKLDSALKDTAHTDTTRTDTIAATAAPGPVAVTPPPPVLKVADPSDSAEVAAFAVELVAENTQAGAIFKLQKDGKDLPAATFAPALIQGARWYKVVSGAFENPKSADSLLNVLKRRKLLVGGESVVRLPFAFRIDSGVPAKAVPGMVASYADRGQPVYALRQQDGTAWLLVGAFATIEQASLYAESLRASSITPVLVYRKGRMF